MKLLSDVDGVLILLSGNPFDFHVVTLLVLATVLKYPRETDRETK